MRRYECLSSRCVGCEKMPIFDFWNAGHLLEERCFCAVGQFLCSYVSFTGVPAAISEVFARKKQFFRPPEDGRLLLKPDCIASFDALSLIELFICGADWVVGSTASNSFVLNRGTADVWRRDASINSLHYKVWDPGEDVASMSGSSHDGWNHAVRLRDASINSLQTKWWDSLGLGQGALHRYCNYMYISFYLLWFLTV